MRLNLLGRLAFGALRAYSQITPTQRGAYRLVRIGRRFVRPSFWRGPFTTPGPATLHLDLSTYPDCCMACGLYELDTLRVLRRLLRPGMHFVDCGANIGYFAIMAARTVGDAGRVDAIEPDPLNRARLEEHLSLNGLRERVRVHAVAASDAAGSATLYHPVGDARNHGEASLIPGAVGTTSQTYNVPTAPLDDLLDHTPDLIKMDIEGGELSALRGMSRLLREPRPPRLIIEHNPESARAAGHRSGDLLRAIHEANPVYRAYWIGWRLRQMAADEIDAMARQGNILYQPI
jgi:FkbM family methyltransferase